MVSSSIKARKSSARLRGESAMCRSTRIKPVQIRDFLNGPRTGAGTWRKKFGLLKLFFEYWTARGLLDGSPMPPLRLPAALTVKPYVPYVYTRNEVRVLLRGTSLWENSSWNNRETGRMDARTFRMFLLTLYATGMRTGEALHLLRKDVEVNRGAITIHSGRSTRPRTIPIGPDLKVQLQRHKQSLAKLRGRVLISLSVKMAKLSMELRWVGHSASCAALQEFSGTMGRSISLVCTTCERLLQCIVSPVGCGREPT